ncbi:MAG: type II toxin-antitoxin system HicB family antitoxin [Candidatus Binatia bacterium]
MANRHTYDNVSPEELAEARHYAMEIEWSPEDEVFVVSFPDAPGVLTHGATPEEAAAMGEDAIITWLTALHDASLPVPPPTVTARQASVTAPDRLQADRIRTIRRHLDVSQRVFADMLNVSLATVRAWEQGLRTPDGAATRLLSIAEHHPETLIEISNLQLQL